MRGIVPLWPDRPEFGEHNQQLPAAGTLFFEVLTIKQRGPSLKPEALLPDLLRRIVTGQFLGLNANVKPSPTMAAPGTRKAAPNAFFRPEFLDTLRVMT